MRRAFTLFFRGEQGGLSDYPDVEFVTRLARAKKIKKSMQIKPSINHAFDWLDQLFPFSIEVAQPWPTTHLMSLALSIASMYPQVETACLV